MNMKPPLLEMIDMLLSIPSVSSVEPDLDQGNQGVIDQLANWLDGLGYRIEIIPVLNKPGKPIW